MPEDNDTVLLDYALSTDPAPVPASTAQVVNQARVNIGISASTTVYCSQLVIAVPIGTDDASLYAQAPAGSSNSNKWAVTAQLRRGRDLWDGLDEDQEYSTFVYDCVSSTDYRVDYNLVFGVFGAVNQTVGDAEIAIQETSGTSSDPSTFTPKAGYFPVRKEWPAFYLKNLVAATLASPTVPATDFAESDPVRLSWESNGTYFQLFAKGETWPIYTGTATTYTLEEGLSRDTTFVLAASMTGSPGNDVPQGGYEPIYLYDALTVSVWNPLLTPSSVTVSGTLQVSGTSYLSTTETGSLSSSSVSVDGSLDVDGSVDVDGSLDVDGSTSLSDTTVGDGLTVRGSTELEESLSVSGSTSLSDATVTGTLSGTGSASLNDLTVRGLYGSYGRVELLGSGSLVAQGADLDQTSVYAATDGFAVAQVLTPGDNSQACYAYGWIYTAGSWFGVQGGTVGSFGPGWSDFMNTNPNTITVPVPAGSYWYYESANPSNNQVYSDVQFWWFPLGSDYGATATYRRLTAEERVAEQVEVPPARPAVPDIAAAVERRENAAAAFVERLAAALEADLAEEVRADLTRLLNQH